MQGESRLPVLDGWRGLSIVLVLAAHLLPLGPTGLDLNAAVAAAGMALFFTLSGFLITGFLLRNDNVDEFLISRLARIVPLVWLFLLIALPLAGVALSDYPAHFFFFGNLPPFPLHAVTAHLWSLCVEMQFYVAAAIVVFMMGRRGLRLIPLSAIAVTLVRIANNEPFSIVTWMRVDEILAGGTLALLYFGVYGDRLKVDLSGLNPVLLALLFLASCHEASGSLAYLRPYLAALLVGCTLPTPASNRFAWLAWQPLVYIAAVSYALYIIHPLLAHTWLGSGEGWNKYTKRPLLLAVLFALAHISTFHYERRWTAMAKAHIDTRRRRHAARPQTAAHDSPGG